MKRLFKFCALVSVTCFSLSCASTDRAGLAARPRFHESARANVVLQFNSWEHINMIRPDYRDNGFRHPIRRADLGLALDRFKVRRELAVVVVGASYEVRLAEVIGGWREVLAANGFQRAIILRATGSDNIDGAVILDDAELTLKPLAKL